MGRAGEMLWNTVARGLGVTVLRGGRPRLGRRFLLPRGRPGTTPHSPWHGPFLGVHWGGQWQGIGCHARLTRLKVPSHLTVPGNQGYGWMDRWTGARMNSTRARGLFPMRVFRPKDAPDIGNSDRWGRGSRRGQRWCDRIQLEAFCAWVPIGPQPEAGPGGQGEVGLPR